MYCEILNPGIPGLSNQSIPNPGIGKYDTRLQTLRVIVCKLNTFISLIPTSRSFWLMAMKRGPKRAYTDNYL